MTSALPYLNRIAGDLVAYVDDLRAIGFSLEQAWKIVRWVASKLEFLGIQDTVRKRRIDNGPWAGGKFGTNNQKITKTVAREKWHKGRNYVMELKEDIRKNPDQLFSYKRLERISFFCYLAMVFEIFFPFLKGFHLTLAQHLPQRNEEGWKLSDLEWVGRLEHRVEEGRMSREDSML